MISICPLLLSPGIPEKESLEGQVGRITKIGVALAGAGVAMGMTAAPANAATGSWTPYDSFSTVAASGTYSRSSTTVTVRGTLKDSRRDGYTSCVRFEFIESGQPRHLVTVKIMGTSNGSQYHYDGRASVSLSGSSNNTGHLNVQECARRTTTGRYSYGRSTNIY
jgi:hypothetical protein